MTEKQTYLGINIPSKMHDSIVRLVERGKYLNKSDFVRSAIRTEIEKNNRSEMPESEGK